MKVLFVVPEIRIDSGPMHFPFWAGKLAAIVEKKGGNVGGGVTTKEKKDK